MQERFCQLGQAVIEIEAQAVADLRSRIDAKFALACELLLHEEGRIVVMGMGKSGHVGKKMAATFASTGSPAFFVHPAEASHGDLGMITAKDRIIAISYSGESEELIRILPLIKRSGIPLISLTCRAESTIAKVASVNLDISVKQEACPLGLAPTSSTTATLAMGDALAVALLDAKGFTEDDFARSHPGGLLGKRLLLRVEDLMHRGTDIPKVFEDTSLRDALIEMTQKGLGMTTVLTSDNTLKGVFTDGDLRRVLDSDYDLGTTLIVDVMNTECKTVKIGMLASEALNIMENYNITSLVVLDEQDKVAGILHMHAILKEGLS